jgi:hypothetical protein
MDYIKQCKSYTKRIVFVCDCTTNEDFNKYFYYLLYLCIQNKVRLYYLTGTLFDQYVDETFHLSLIEHELHLYSIYHLSSMLDEVLYVVKPQLMLNIDIPINIYDLCVPYMCNSQQCSFIDEKQ